MARTISTGNQDFASMRENGDFYVDKTAFIREWWESRDVVTLITRPRRFGKTLNMSTLDWFLSLRHAGRADLFEGLDVFSGPNGGRYRGMQGTWPVVFLSFANVKLEGYEMARREMCRVLSRTVRRFRYLVDSPRALPGAGELFDSVRPDMADDVAAESLNALCEMLENEHGRKAIVLLDEYDAPLERAWAGGYWDEMVGFTRALFNSTFKTNPALERGLMTGVTRVSKESIFSDLNNLRVVSTTTRAYETCFGFTTGEVGAALEEFGMADRMGEVRDWYDGFRFGEVGEIYNPWSVTQYLQSGGEAGPYWANTSSNSLAGASVRTSGPRVKEDFEDLLAGGSVTRPVTEEVVFSDLGRGDAALWGLLVASGYLRVDRVEGVGSQRACELRLTNREAAEAFRSAIANWFEGSDGGEAYSGFVRALLACDEDIMQESLSRVLVECASAFDGGTRASAEAQPERFYHGLVLGMLVTLEDRYRVRSNRESGFGRYDVMLEPMRDTDPAFVIEFKVRRPKREASLEDALAVALAQIDEKDYDAELTAGGIAPGRIRHVGVAFEGKRVLVGIAGA